MRDRSEADAFRAAYSEALAGYLGAEDETALRAAYELGRIAVVNEFSVLDLALVHHEALAAALVGGNPARIGVTTSAAALFHAESLSAFEMVRRGFRDARDAALAERRQAALLRTLSSFMADASLASGGNQSYQELLQLVAEQALELVDAEYCLAAASIGSDPPAVAFTAGGAQPQSIPAWVATAAEEYLSSGPLHRESAADAEGPDVRSGTDSPRNALAAPLRGLDGRAFGSVRLFNRRGGEFTDVDEAALSHLAELAAAALERTQLYTERAPTPSGNDG